MLRFMSCLQRVQLQNSWRVCTNLPNFFSCTNPVCVVVELICCTSSWMEMCTRLDVASHLFLPYGHFSWFSFEKCRCSVRTWTTEGDVGAPHSCCGGSLATLIVRRGTLQSWNPNPPPCVPLWKCPARESRVSTVSTRPQRWPCLSGSRCGWTPPPHPRPRSDPAGSGAGGRSRWTRWCTAAGSSTASATRLRRCSFPSWRTGRNRWRWSSTGGTARRWTGRGRSGPGGGRWPGTAAAGRCGTSPSARSPWPSPWWCPRRRLRRGCERTRRWRRRPSGGSGLEGPGSGCRAETAGRWKVAPGSFEGHWRRWGQDLGEIKRWLVTTKWVIVGMRLACACVCHCRLTCESRGQIAERRSTRRKGIRCVHGGRGYLADVGIRLVVGPWRRRLHLSGVWERETEKSRRWVFEYYVHFVFKNSQRLINMTAASCMEPHWQSTPLVENLSRSPTKTSSWVNTRDSPTSSRTVEVLWMRGEIKITRTSPAAWTWPGRLETSTDNRQP